MDTTILEELGLTKGEIKVYLTLLRIGTSKSGRIIKETKIGNSGTYRSLESLKEKGLISYIIKNNVKHFSATDPKILLKLLEDQKTKLNNLIPKLEQKKEEKQESAVYEGYKAITTAYEECLDELKSGEESLFFSIGEEDLENKNIQTFFKNLATKRKAKKITMRGIATKNTKKIFEKYPTKINMKYTDLKLPTGVSIYKTKTIIVTWKEKPTAIVITSKNITDSYKEFFEEIWKISKK